MNQQQLIRHACRSTSEPQCITRIFYPGPTPCKQLSRLIRQSEHQYLYPAHGRHANQRRYLHGTKYHSQSQAQEASDPSPKPPPSVGLKLKDGSSIRQRLRRWQHEEEIKVKEAAADEARKEQELNQYDPERNVALEEEMDETLVDSFTEEFDKLSENYTDATSIESVFHSGDVVEMPAQKGGDMYLAVFLKSTQKFMVLYSMHGKLIISASGQPYFAAQGEISQAELDPILEYVPQDLYLEPAEFVRRFGEAVPREAGAPVLKKLKQIQEDANEAFRTHSKALNNIHNLVAHRKEPRILSLEYIAAKVTGAIPSEAKDIPNPVLLAVCHFLKSGVFGFKIPNRNFAVLRQVIVESKYSVEAVGKVAGWVRDYQEEVSLQTRGIQADPKVKQGAERIHAFAKKARRLVAASQKFRVYSPHGGVIGTKQEFLDNPKLAAELVKESFDRHDQDIIHFLNLYVAGKAFFFHQYLVGMPAVIVRATGLQAPDMDVDEEIVHTLLVEMGVMQPFNDAEAWDRNLRLHNEDLEKAIDRMYERLEAGESIEVAANLKDSMVDMRRDWGDMPVFCFDSADTIEVDDGISIEDIPGSSGQMWLHTHIAHPSAFTKPTQAISRYAENNFMTAYMSETKLQMMPKFMSDKFSVQPNAPALTISARVNANGDLLEYKIQPSIVRNVIRISNQAVNDFFDYNDQFELSTVISVGPNTNSEQVSSIDQSKETSSKEVAESVPPQHHQTLRHILSITAKLSGQRRQNLFSAGAFRTHTTATGLPRDPDIPKHRPQLAAHRIVTTPTVPSYALNSPKLEVRVNPSFEADMLAATEYTVPSSIIVSSMMLQANGIVARWAAARNIPLPYAGTRYPFQNIAENLPLMRERLMRMVKGLEPLDRSFLAYLRTSFGVRHTASRPIAHTLMGTLAYTKITSPLRRYYDLLAMWQVDGALREEHRLGHSLVEENFNDDTPIKLFNSKEPLDGNPNATDPSGNKTNTAIPSPVSATEATMSEQPVETDTTPSSPETPKQSADATADALTTATSTSQSDQNYLPLSAPEIDAIIRRCTYTDFCHMRYNSAHSKHFNVQAFARALYLDPDSIKPAFRDGRPPTDDHFFNPRKGLFTAMIGKAGSRRLMAVLEGLEVLVETENKLGEDGNHAIQGERWAVQIERIRLGSKRIQMRLVKRLSVAKVYS